MRLAAAFLLLPTTALANGGSAPQHQQDCHVTASGTPECEPSSCRLYLAYPSTSDDNDSDNADWTVYAGKSFAAGTELSRDLCVPIVDLEWHTLQLILPHKEGLENLRKRTLVDDIGMQSESWSTDVRSFCPGLPALLSNVDDVAEESSNNNNNNDKFNVHVGAPIFDTTAASMPRSDPTAGASTLYYNATVTTLQPIAAGQALVSRHTKSSESGFEQQSIDWLEENAICLDVSMVSRPSTVAGHGAFATRALSKGQTVALSPVLAAHKDMFQIYNFTTRDADPVLVNQNDKEDGEEEKEEETKPAGLIFQRHLDDVVSQQLMINYCFGNRHVPMAFCPLGLGVSSMNHQRPANVGIRWNADSSSPLEDISAQDLLRDQGPPLKLVLEYYALNDIAADDELFVDYGNWKSVFDTHDDDYDEAIENDPNKDRYLDARVWNAQFPDHVLRTVDEQAYDPYPTMWQLRCHSSVLAPPAAEAIHTATPVWSPADYGYACRVLDRFVAPPADSSNEAASSRPTMLYTVELELEHPTEPEDKVLWIQRTEVPREAIQFFNMPGTGNLQWHHAFRRTAQMSSTMTPAHWDAVEDDEEDENDDAVATE